MIAAKNAKVAKADWKKVKLGEVCSIRRGASPRPIHSFIQPSERGGIPWVKIADANAGDSRYIYRTNESIIQEGGKYSLAVIPDDLIVSNSATPGLPRIMKIKACIHDGWLLLRDFNGVHRDFLFYKFLDIRPYLLNHANGSVFQNLKTDIVKEFLISLPSLPTQRKIAAVLGALDDKIENNRKICANLEAQAQALFKSWFVDFEPWGGKMPKDWKMGSLYEFADIIYGAPFKSKLFNEKGDGRPIIRIRDLKNNETKTYTTERHDKEYVVQAGDLVVGMDGEFRPYVWGNKPALLNQRVCVFKPKDKVSTAYLLFSIKPQLEFVEATEAATTVIHIGKEDFDSFKISIPSKDWLSKFNGIAQKQIDLSTRLRQYNVALAELRDALLPKLMSGELDVDDVEV